MDASLRIEIFVADLDLATDLQRRPWGLRDFRLDDPDGYDFLFTSRS